MPVDTSFYQNIQPVQVPDGLNKLAQFGQIQQQQNVNRLAQQQYDQAARANTQAEGLNNLYRNALNPDGTVNQAALIQGAAQGGFGSAIPGIQKSFAEADKAAAEVAQTKAQTGKVQGEALNTALQQGRDILTQVNDPASGRQWLMAQYQNPTISPIFSKLGPLDQALQRYDQQTSTPEGFAQWRQGAMLTAEQLIKQTSPDANAVLSADTSRLNNRETNATSRANNASTNATAQRGQNMTDNRARDQIAQGKTPAGYRTNPDGSMSAIPGGPADLKTNKEGVQKVADAKDVLDILNQAEPLLNDATGSYLGVGADMAAQAFGNTTKGASATAKLKVLQGALVSKMPKMSGPQSDKDVLLYREMAGQIGDPTIPVGQRKAALATVRSLNEKYAGMQPGASKPASAPSSDGWSVTEVK